MRGPLNLVLAAACVTMSCHASRDAPHIAMTHITGSLGEKQGSLENDIPVVKHKKEAGNGYVKGSPLYKKQQKEAGPKQAEPEKGDRSKPSLAVIFGGLFIGILILGCAAFINKRELVKSEVEPRITSQTRLQSQKLQSQRLGAPDYVEYTVPQSQVPIPVPEYLVERASYPPVSQSYRPEYNMPSNMPIRPSSGVVYAPGSMPTPPPSGLQSLPPAQGGYVSPQYASMPAPISGSGTMSPMAPPAMVSRAGSAQSMR